MIHIFIPWWMVLIVLILICFNLALNCVWIQHFKFLHKRIAEEISKHIEVEKL